MQLSNWYVRKCKSGIRQEKSEATRKREPHNTSIFLTHHLT
uniref:Uncharacterized protein n=1 Tax=Rhizophora mucronata TaxID=61149 RepID=A0A2P2N310_RHIMU